MSRAILLITLKSEIEVLIRTLAYVCRESKPDDSILIFINGGTGRELDFLKINRIPVEIFASHRNLGVAGARSVLLNKTLNKSCRYIHILDNDIILPENYFETIEEFHSVNEKSGVVGACLLNFNRVKEKLHLLDRSFQFSGEMHPIYSHTEILKIVSSTDEDPFFHLGTNADSDKTYFGTEELFQYLCVKVGIKKAVGFHGTLKNSNRIRELMKSDVNHSVSVSNVAGACQCFELNQLKIVGNIDCVFSPYGFEDVDFCLRFRKFNYINYVTNSAFVIHGFDNRHKLRASGLGELNSIYNDFRSFSHLLENNLNLSAATNVIYRRLLIYYLYRKLGNEKDGVSKMLYGKYGIAKAVRERLEK